jgi:hypothetical protein
MDHGRRRHDAGGPSTARSSTDNPAFLTQDEESSGIIDAEEILGPGWFLLDVQVPKLDVAGSTPVARSPGLVEERIQADTRPLAIVEQAQ